MTYFPVSFLYYSCERLQLREREGGDGGRGEGGDGGRGEGGDGGKGGERERRREKGGLVSNIVLPMVKQLSIYLLIYQTLTKSTRLYVNICVSQCDEILTQYIHVRTSKQHMSLPVFKISLGGLVQMPAYTHRERECFRRPNCRCAN